VRFCGSRIRSFHLPFAPACILSEPNERAAPGGRVTEKIIASKNKGPCMAIVNLTRLARSMLALTAAVVWSALGWPAPASAETPIHFTLGRKIDGPAAPFFLAIDKGYFKAEGLDVTIDPASGPLDPINRLASGSYEMGAGDINLLIKYRDKNPGTPIKAVFAVFDKPPYAIIARKSRGIAAPKDLEGKKLGAPSAEGTFAQWPIFAEVNGIDQAKVTIENVGLPVREPMLAAGEVDAVTGYSFVSYINLKDDGVPLNDLVVLLMADYGVALYADAIMVSPAFASEKPDAVRGLLRAYTKALKDTVRDPASAIDSVLRRMDGGTKDVELERLRMAIRDNIVTPAVRTNGFGRIDPARFATAIDQLALAYPFQAKDKAAGVFDSSFLQGSADR
jgi:NitT/TauT family transport system substrate-binding protein